MMVLIVKGQHSTLVVLINQGDRVSSMLLEKLLAVQGQKLSVVLNRATECW